MLKFDHKMLLQNTQSLPHKYSLYAIARKLDNETRNRTLLIV